MWPSDVALFRHLQRKHLVNTRELKPITAGKCLRTRSVFSSRCNIFMFVLVFTAKNAESPPQACIVYAGLEPLVFTNLFPFWEVDENVSQLSIAVRKQSFSST